jgi:hypothetical protein
VQIPGTQAFHFAIFPSDAVAEKQGIWAVRAERFPHLNLSFPPRVIPVAAESFTGLPVTPNSPIVKMFENQEIGNSVDVVVLDGKRSAIQDSRLCF